MTFDPDKLKRIIEGALLAAGKPLTVQNLAHLFDIADDLQPSREEILAALEDIETDLADRGFELKKVASGFRLQVREEYAPWISRLWEEKPQRYSRALLETLSLIAYRQPITRGEIEDIRGVAVSTNIMRTLLDRDWVRVVGHREVPGKPAMYATTKAFLDYFNLKSLNELPTLAEIRDLESPELDFEGDGVAPAESAEGQTEVEGEGGELSEESSVEEAGNASGDVDGDAPSGEYEAAEVVGTDDEDAGESAFVDDELPDTFIEAGDSPESSEQADVAEDQPDSLAEEAEMEESDAETAKAENQSNVIELPTT